MTLAALALLVSGSVYASTVGFSSAVTGATDSASTALIYTVPSNYIYELVGVIPVVSTVTGSPASMAASVNVGTTGAFNTCGAIDSPSCSNNMWAAQWTIVSAPTGIQAVNSYQGTSIKLVNNSGGGIPIYLRCQVGQMTGSCIFVSRFQLTTDPRF